MFQTVERIKPKCLPMRTNFSSETTGHIICYFYKYDLNPKLDLEYLSLWSGKSHVMSFSYVSVRLHVPHKASELHIIFKDTAKPSEK